MEHGIFYLQWECLMYNISQEFTSVMSYIWDWWLCSKGFRFWRKTDKMTETTFAMKILIFDKI